AQRTSSSSHRLIVNLVSWRLGGSKFQFLSSPADLFRGSMDCRDKPGNDGVGGGRTRTLNCFDRALPAPRGRKVTAGKIIPDKPARLGRLGLGGFAFHCASPESCLK